MVELELEAKFDNFVKVREHLFYILENNGCSNDIKSEIYIIAEEIFTNIIRHSYNGECSKSIFIKIEVIGNILNLKFMDFGKIFENIKIPKSLSEIKGEVGGLGLYLIYKLSDQYNYFREGNININEVKKRIR